MMTTSLVHVPKYKILASCAGLGMGNASRLLAVIESLNDQKQMKNCSLSLSILSWGAGYQFLEKNQKSSELPFTLAKLNAYSGEKNWLMLLRTYFANTWKLWQSIRREQPDLLLLDSDYHFLSYVFLKTPKIYIGQAQDILMRAQTYNYRAKTLREKINFLIREKWDACYQSFISTEVLVPSFENIGLKKNNFTHIPLIVRKEFLLPQKTTEDAEGGETNTVLILLSGSGIEKQNFLELEKAHHLRIISPSSQKELELSSATLLDSHKIIFTQGGLTSISEVIARNKTLVVFPLELHPEQIINAVTIEHLRRGIRANINELQNFTALIKRVNEFMKKSRPSYVNCTGSKKCAEIIFSYLTGSSQNS